MTPAPGEEPFTGTGGESPAQLNAGRVGRPHGLDGSFYVTRPRARLLTLGGEVTVGGERREVVRRSGTDRHPILRLAGVGDRAGAEALRGAEVTVQQRDAPALGEGEWWAHELEGCEVRDGERLLGTVTRLLELPSCEVLEVDPAGGGPVVLVPMVSDAVRSVDPAGRRIEIDLDFIGLPGDEEAGAEPRSPEAEG
ncbi:MAG TPA: ribosome maturation factor RimM [Solirubrobacteraceae bacterium]